MHFAHRAMNLHAPKPHSLICFRLLPVLLSVLLVTMSVTAQQEDKQEAATTIKKDVNVVNVLASVRNKQGQIVNDLTKDDFKLEVDGHPQAIKYFSKVTDLPLTLGLLVDTSLSQRRVLDKERTASYTFLNDLLDQTRDKAFIVHFDFDIELLQDLTSSRPKLE
ncbi:MAG TPA: VWA domain-containing protein, partial [Terriglobales bacterium]